MRKGWFKSFAGMLAMLLLTLGWGVAEGMPPDATALVPGATIEQNWEASGAQLHRLCLEDTGEVVVVLMDTVGQAMLAETVEPASVSFGTQAMDRSAAEELIQSAYPDCRVLYSEDGASGKRMAVAGDGYWGSIVVAGGCIVSRRLEAGEIYSNGRLSLYGALRVLELYRPEAELRAIELDDDDGQWIYEGDAMLHGELYEFELDAVSACLLEWERD